MKNERERFQLGPFWDDKGLSHRRSLSSVRRDAQSRQRRNDLARQARLELECQTRIGLEPRCFPLGTNAAQSLKTPALCRWPGHSGCDRAEPSHYAAKVFGKSTGLQTKCEDESRGLNNANYSGPPSWSLVTGNRGACASRQAQGDDHRWPQVCIAEGGRELQAERGRKAEASHKETNSPLTINPAVTLIT